MGLQWDSEAEFQHLRQCDEHESVQERQELFDPDSRCRKLNWDGEVGLQQRGEHFGKSGSHEQEVA